MSRAGSEAFQNTKLSQAQIGRLVTIGAPDEVIAQEIRARGIAFEPTQKTIEDLQKGGAGPQVLGALRELMQMQDDPERICDDAWDKTVDHGKDVIPYFDVKLQEGCWGGWVTIPRSWQGWLTQPMTPVDSYWYAIWWENEPKPYGPYRANDRPHLENRLLTFRLQGHGTIRYYAPVAPADMNSGEWHSDIAGPEKEAVYRVGDSGVIPPSVRYKVEPEFSEEARRARIGYGRVVAKVVIAKSGVITHIQIVNSTGYGLDAKAIEALQRWRFKPAEKDGEPVACQAMIEIEFKQL